MADPPLVFRTARHADLPAIVALLADDVLGRTRERTNGADASYSAAFDAIDADANHVLAVAESAGTVVGTLQLSFLPSLTYQGGWRAQIEAVRVASDRRGQGVGVRFIQWAIDQARGRQCRMVQLTTDKRRPDAIDFYQNLGFQATHEGMKLHLNPNHGSP